MFFASLTTTPGKGTVLLHFITVPGTTTKAIANTWSSEGKLWQTDCILKGRDIANKGPPHSHSYGFSSSHVWMWELDHKEGWALKNWCFWTVVLEKTLESPLDCNIKPVTPKGNQSKYSLEGLMLKLKLQYFGLLMWRTHLKRSWCWERLKTGGERDDRGQDGWMASLAQWTWVWASSRGWWRTGKPGMLLSMGWQRVGHN